MGVCVDDFRGEGPKTTLHHGILNHI
jgi:hypothetical protein